jgi:hypothetical protein
MLPDLERAIMKLASLSEERAADRVYEIRQVVASVQREGFEEGYHTAMKDRANADVLADADARTGADAERARIAAHFDNMVVTREWRRRFEERHPEHLSNGLTVHGLLSAVVDEIKGMSRG